MIKVKKMDEYAILPTKGDLGAAGWDLYACLPEGSITIWPKEVKMIDTGIAFEPPHGYFGGIYARSGLATKQGLRPANCVGVADESYRDSYKVALFNDSGRSYTINHGDRIAQVVFHPYLTDEIVEVDDLSETERDKDGFGSTGK